MRLLKIILFTVRFVGHVWAKTSNCLDSLSLRGEKATIWKLFFFMTRGLSKWSMIINQPRRVMHVIENKTSVGYAGKHHQWSEIIAIKTARLQSLLDLLYNFYWSSNEVWLAFISHVCVGFFGINVQVFREKINPTIYEWETARQTIFKFVVFVYYFDRELQMIETKWNHMLQTTLFLPEVFNNQSMSRKNPCRTKGSIHFWQSRFSTRLRILWCQYSKLIGFN